MQATAAVLMSGAHDSGSHQPDAEAEVLGAFLVGGASERLTSATEVGLEAWMFEGARARVVWEAIVALRARGETVSVVAVCDEITRAGRLEEGGGWDYVASLEDATVSDVHAERWARRVRESALRRRQRRNLEAALRDLDEPGRAVDELLGAEQERLDALRAGLALEEGLPRATPAAEVTPDEGPAYDLTGFGLRDEIHVIAGDGGAGKTSLGLAVAAAYASGHSALDRFPVQRSGPVLVVSEEDSAGVLRNRVQALCHGHGWDAEQVLARVHLLCRREVRLDALAWQRHLSDEVERIGAVAILLDPWFELFGGQENSNSEARAVIRFVRQLATRASVWIGAHAGKVVEGKRKIDRIRGASALFSAARVVYFVEPDERGIAVHPLKFSRSELPARFVVGRTVEADAENPAVWTSARLTYLTAEHARELGAEKLVREALGRAETLNSSELKEHAKGGGTDAVELSAAIKSLERRGVIGYQDGPRGSKLWRLLDTTDYAGFT